VGLLRQKKRLGKKCGGSYERVLSAILGEGPISDGVQRAVIVSAGKKWIGTKIVGKCPVGRRTRVTILCLRRRSLNSEKGLTQTLNKPSERRREGRTNEKKKGDTYLGKLVLRSTKAPQKGAWNWGEVLPGALE